MNALVAGNGSYIVQPCGHDLHGPTPSPSTINVSCPVNTRKSSYVNARGIPPASHNRRGPVPGEGGLREGTPRRGGGGVKDKPHSGCTLSRGYYRPHPKDDRR